MATDTTTAYINYLLSENCFLSCKCDDMSQMLQNTQANVEYLNTFIHTTFDVSNCSHIVVYDVCGNTMSCLNSDGSGGFMPCVNDADGNFLPCVLPPTMRDIDKKKPSKKRGIYDYYNPNYPPYYPYYKSYYDPYYNSYYSPYRYPYYQYN